MQKKKQTKDDKSCPRRQQQRGKVDQILLSYRPELLISPGPTSTYHFAPQSPPTATLRRREAQSA